MRLKLFTAAFALSAGLVAPSAHADSMRVADLTGDLWLATKERDDLRRQLQRIRFAHEELHEAIFPDLHRPGS